MHAGGSLFHIIFIIYLSQYLYNPYVKYRSSGPETRPGVIDYLYALIILITYVYILFNLIHFSLSTNDEDPIDPQMTFILFKLIYFILIHNALFIMWAIMRNYANTWNDARALNSRGKLKLSAKTLASVTRRITRTNRDEVAMESVENYYFKHCDRSFYFLYGTRERAVKSKRYSMGLLLILLLSINKDCLRFLLMR